MYTKAISTLFLLSVILPSSLADPSLKSTDSFVVEFLLNTPKGFTTHGLPERDATLDLRIALKQKDMVGLEQELYAVSDPDSDRYGNHLSKEQIEDYTKPTSETVDLVTGWLALHGIASSVDNTTGEWLHFSTSVEKANNLLEAKFTTFKREADGFESIRTMSYSIPEIVKDHIDFIHPTVAFPLVPSQNLMFTTPTPTTRRAVKNSTEEQLTVTGNVVPASCATDVTPACLQSFYGLPTAIPEKPVSSISVTGFGEEYANFADLTLFLEEFRPDLPSNPNLTVELIDMGTNSQNPTQAGQQANTDVQYTAGIASNIPVTFISVGSKNSDGLSGFMDVVDFVLGLDPIPTVLTTSYGFDESAIPMSLATRLCESYMKLGARGVSIVFAAGDGGVAGIQAEDCTTFVPTFPSSCPYVTSVGSTTGINETAASFTSGGFSNYFPAPNYQVAAASAYVSSISTTDAGLFNPNGRGFPDVSTQGANIEMVLGGNNFKVSGTGASASIWASIIALVNDALITEDRPPLGFLNPTFYSTLGRSAFIDITRGSNPGCHTNGFPVRQGWDPVTGLGTPNFADLLVALNIPVFPC